MLPLALFCLLSTVVQHITAASNVSTPSSAPSYGTNTPSLMGGTALSVKYDSCRRVKTAIIDGESYERPGCLHKSDCDDIPDTNLRTVSDYGIYLENDGGSIHILKQSSEYDTNTICLYDNTNARVLQNDSLYVYNFTSSNDAGESCGCIWDSPNSALCYECAIYFCTQNQPSSCSENENDIDDDTEQNPDSGANLPQTAKELASTIGKIVGYVIAAIFAILIILSCVGYFNGEGVCWYCVCFAGLLSIFQDGEVTDVAQVADVDFP